jgi:hypothetical protein
LTVLNRISRWSSSVVRRSSCAGSGTSERVEPWCIDPRTSGPRSDQNLDILSRMKESKWFTGSLSEAQAMKHP